MAHLSRSFPVLWTTINVSQTRGSHSTLYTWYPSQRSWQAEMTAYWIEVCFDLASSEGGSYGVHLGIYLTTRTQITLANIQHLGFPVANLEFNFQLFQRENFILCQSFRRNTVRAWAHQWYAYAQLSPLYLLSTLYVTHVMNYSRPSTAFLYCKWWKAGWGLGTRLKNSYTFAGLQLLKRSMCD